MVFFFFITVNWMETISLLAINSFMLMMNVDCAIKQKKEKKADENNKENKPLNDNN